MNPFKQIDSRMKNFLSNDFIILIIRVGLGILFIMISIEKIAEPAAFAKSIDNYRLIPVSITPALATVFPWLELLCGMALLFGVLMRGSSLLLAGMLAVFTIALLSALIRGLDISCGCFTQDPTAGKIGWMKVLENAGLLALSVILLVSKSKRFTFETLSSKEKKVF